MKMDIQQLFNRFPGIRLVVGEKQMDATLAAALERLDMEELDTRFDKQFSAWLETLSDAPLDGLAGACASYLRHWGSGGGSYRIERAATAACVTDRPVRLAILLYAAIRTEGTDAIVTCQLIQDMFETAATDAACHDKINEIQE